MAVPKKRLTKRRQGNRRSHDRLIPKPLALCSNCNHTTMPHRICPNCGFYKGKQILAKLV